MNGVGKISILHVILLTMTVIGLRNHVTLIPSILQVGGRDSWLSVILAAIFTLPWLFLLLYIHKKSNQQSYREWLQQKLGKFFSTVILYSIAFFLVIMAAFTIIETIHWVSATFLVDTPPLLLLLVYSLLCISLATMSIETIAILNAIVLMVVIILGFFVGFTNFQVKEYELLLPFLEHGMDPVVKTMVYPASGYVEVLMFLFIQHQYKDRIRWYHFIIILILLVWLTLGPLIGAIIEFGPTEAAKQNYPAYEEWGLTRMGRYIEHLDFFSIYQWLTGAFVRIGFILFVVVQLLNFTGKKKRIWFILAPFFFIVSWSLTFIGDSMFQKIKGHYFVIANLSFFIFLSVIFMIIALVSKKTSKKGKVKTFKTESGEQ